MTGWVLFYDDGTVITSEDCAPADVPGYGMLCGAQEDVRDRPDAVGWVTFAGEYVYHLPHRDALGIDRSMWFPAQTWADIEERLLMRLPMVGVCKGRTVPSDAFEPIWAECRRWAEARGLPRKDGYAPGEPMRGQPLR